MNNSQHIVACKTQKTATKFYAHLLPFLSLCWIFSSTLISSFAASLWKNKMNKHFTGFNKKKFEFSLLFGQVALKFLSTDDLPGLLPIRQLKMWSQLSDRRIYFSLMTGRHIFEPWLHTSFLTHAWLLNASCTNLYFSTFFITFTATYVLVFL